MHKFRIILTESSYKQSFDQYNNVKINYTESIMDLDELKLVWLIYFIDWLMARPGVDKYLTSSTIKVW